MPMLRLLGESRETSWLPKYTAPAVCFSRPAMIRISVVLPQPDGPRRQVTCPLGKVNDTSSTAWSEPKVLVSCSTRISDMANNRVGRRKLVATSGGGGREAGTAPDPFASRGVEQGQVVGKDRNRHHLIEIVTPVMIAVDHRQEFPTRREVDDILAAEILAQDHRSRELERSTVRSVRFTAGVREPNPLWPEPDDDVGRRSIKLDLRQERKERGRAPQRVITSLERSIHEIGWGKPDERHGSHVMRVAVEVLR